MKKIIVTIILMLAVVAYADSTVKTAYFIEIDGVISGVTHKFIKKSIETAKVANAGVLVIKLDTPGGILDSTRKIVTEILESPVPVVVFVAPQGAQAASAGTFITLAADYAVMADASNIGAAHPVSITGKDIEGDMRDKAVHSTESFMRSVAEKRKRNVKEAVLSVTESKSFTTAEALKAGVIDFSANSDEELLKILAMKMKFKGFERVDITPDFMERVAFALGSPNVLIILLLSGIFMFFLEVKLPGSFIFAGTGTVALILFLVGINIIPVNTLGIILLLCGIICLVLEIFVTSFGILTLAGIGFYIGGAAVLFDTGETQGVKVSFWLIFITVLIALGIIGFIGRLILKDLKKRSRVGVTGMYGKKGVVTNINGKLQVHVNGEIWGAKSNELLAKGDEVEITGVDGLVVHVKKVDR